MSASILLCSCAKTQILDPDAISSATGFACSHLHSGLCGHEADLAAKAISTGEAIIACGQEGAFFDALAEEAGAPPPLMVDLRDRAGWSDDPADKTPKIAALLALSQMSAPPEKALDVTSEGMCLIIGASAVVLPAAAQLAETLSVTCVTTDDPDMTLSGSRSFDCHQGNLRQATGSIGRFELIFDDFRAANPAGRGAMTFGDPRNGAKSGCDIILDLRGDAPLFPAHEKRDGYLRADPGDPLAVARSVYDASHLVGVFEKTLFIAMEESLCAHSRAEQEACRRCLDLCPTGAITPAGEHVSIDPMICAGCGACAAACPSGAIAYEAPTASHVFAQISAASRAYRKAGGEGPRLLAHDPEHGSEMISLSARYGRGLPADVVPLEISALASFGHAEIMVALANGFGAVHILVGPKSDVAAIKAQAELAGAMATGLGLDDDRIRILDPDDPDQLSDLLYGHAPSLLAAKPVMALGGRRDATRLAAKALATTENAVVTLPEGAPYGAVLVDTEACTLCLSCAGLCPSGALGDNPDMPQLRFQEDACLQCGLCVSVCPEDAITLQPQLNLADEAFSHRVVHEEEPFACIECGAFFGVKSTIERIVEKLEGKHSMFTNSDNTKLIRMCDNCRVNAQYHADAVPFFAGPRPKVRTAEDLD